MDEVAPSMSDAERAVADLMYDTLGAYAHWQWQASHLEEAPGWYRVWQQGPRPHDILIGGVQFFHPERGLVSLSSNPMAHGWQQTIAVLTDPALTGCTGAQLSEEIFRRTRAARSGPPA